MDTPGTLEEAERLLAELDKDRSETSHGDAIGGAVAWSIREQRIRRRWDQDTLALHIAQVLGREPLNKSTISRWETHTKAWNLEELMALCMVFEVNLADLMYPGDYPDANDTPKVLGRFPYSEVWTTMFESIPRSAARWKELEERLDGTS